MAFDGLVTRAVAAELSEKLTLGKVEKIYQPEPDELVFNIHTQTGNHKLYMSCASNHARIHLSGENYENPAQPPAFCMLMRKHLHGARIQSVAQAGCERIIEISFETQNELGFSVNKKLIVEIMGKHSNITLTDAGTGRIIDCMKHISIDVNRVRQLLPGKAYEYPPAQDKTPFDEVTEESLSQLSGDKAILAAVGGISPAIARELASAGSSAYAKLCDMRELKSLAPVVYLDEGGAPSEFHAFRMAEFEPICEKKEFAGIGEAVEYYFISKSTTNRVRQKSGDLERSVQAVLDKLYLKKQRLSEDLLRAQNSDELRLYGELLTANLHLVQPGAKSVTVVNYYDGKEISIPLDERLSASRNAQVYFKKYGKAKTAIHEKQTQLDETDIDINYLESVKSFAENAASIEETEALREELVSGGYLSKRKNNFAPRKLKQKPLEYKTSTGYRVLVGRNNVENDAITFKNAGAKDIWLHTKDIHGSHVILFANGLSAEELGEETIYEAAAIAAFHSQARGSENVPVDYVPVKLVKKPAGAKPGMVIFTGNRTVWVNPKLPTINR